ncbi:MAG: TonB-dependent receptor, partial [Candidatus Omnitrophica bacterium]|nr:TonB-dependent receptor [Candidatus Omnitrophota bacterium]
NDITNKDLPYIPDLTANLGVIVQPSSQYSLTFQYRYIGKRTREADDLRGKSDNSQTVDITATFFNLIFNGITARAGVKNLFDSDVISPSSIDTYPDDYPRPGRQYWLELNYQF